MCKHDLRGKVRRRCLTSPRPYIYEIGVRLSWSHLFRLFCWESCGIVRESLGRDGCGVSIGVGVCPLESGRVQCPISLWPLGPPFPPPLSLRVGLMHRFSHLIAIVPCTSYSPWCVNVWLGLYICFFSFLGELAPPAFVVCARRAFLEELRSSRFGWGASLPSPLYAGRVDMA